MGDLQKKLAPVTDANRAISVFDIPSELGSNVRSIGIVELTAEEELQASKRSGMEPMKLAFELAKLSLREVDGSPVSVEDGSADLTWAKFEPKLRTLVMAAYAELHTPEDKILKNFIKTRRVKVG